MKKDELKKEVAFFRSNVDKIKLNLTTIIELDDLITKESEYLKENMDREE